MKSELPKPEENRKRNFQKSKRNFVKKTDPLKKLLENHKKNSDECKELGLLKEKNYLKFFNGGLCQISKNDRNNVFILLPKDLAVLAIMLLLHRMAKVGRLTMQTISDCLGREVHPKAVERSINKLDKLGLIKKSKPKYNKSEKKYFTLTYSFPIWTKFFFYTRRRYGDSIYDQTMDSLVDKPTSSLSGNKLNINNDTSNASLKDLISEFVGSLKMKPKPKPKPPTEEWIPYSVEQPRHYTNEELNFAAMPFADWEKQQNRSMKKYETEGWTYQTRSNCIIDKKDGKKYPTIPTSIFKYGKRIYTVLEVLQKIEGGYLIVDKIITDKIVFTRRTVPWGMEKSYENSVHDDFKVKKWRKFISDYDYKRIRNYECKSDKPYFPLYQTLNFDDFKYYLRG